jgi:DNA-binding MarR family transcriptional regulator
MSRETDLLESVAMSVTLAAKVQRTLFAARLATIGLRLGQPLVLLHLYREDGLSQTQLAERLRVEPPSVTKVVRGMADAGLVVRERDPEDTRVVRVRLSDRGLALRPELEQAWQEASEQVFGGLDAGDRATLKALLDRVVDTASDRSTIP